MKTVLRCGQREAEDILSAALKVSEEAQRSFVESILVVHGEGSIDHVTGERVPAGCAHIWFSDPDPRFIRMLAEAGWNVS